MTAHARVVLQDCKHAIQKHTDDLQAEDFRISWIAIVALLRAVGHVLQKVDACQSAIMKKAIEQKWKELKGAKPEPYIYWEFIEAERNRFLKNYEYSVIKETSLGSPTPGIHVTTDLARMRGGKITSKNIKIKSCISSGRFKGIHEQEVAWMAYDWWKGFLDKIDAICLASSRLK